MQLQKKRKKKKRRKRGEEGLFVGRAGQETKSIEEAGNEANLLQNLVQRSTGNLYQSLTGWRLLIQSESPGMARILVSSTRSFAQQ